jgi:hypothetical protein
MFRAALTLTPSLKPPLRSRAQVKTVEVTKKLAFTAGTEPKPRGRLLLPLPIAAPGAKGAPKAAAAAKRGGKGHSGGGAAKGRGLGGAFGADLFGGSQDEDEAGLGPLEGLGAPLGPPGALLLGAGFGALPAPGRSRGGGAKAPRGARLAAGASEGEEEGGDAPDEDSQEALAQLGHLLGNALGGGGDDRCGAGFVQGPTSRGPTGPWVQLVEAWARPARRPHAAPSLPIPPTPCATPPPATRRRAATWWRCSRCCSARRAPRRRPRAARRR